MGVLARLMEEGVTDSVTDWYGCSGGCMPAFMGALGATPNWLRDVAEHLELSRLIVPDPQFVATFTESWGISDGAALLDFYCRIVDIWEPGASYWTFADLARKRPGTRLTLLATNVTRGCQELFSIDTTPDVCIVREALRASMAMPLIFTPSFNAAGHHLCDGALTEQYVWDSIANKENTLVVVCDDLGIMGRPLADKQMQSIVDYVGRIVQIVRHRNTSPMPRNWIAVNDTVELLQFKITREERLALFEVGKAAANQWLAFRRQAAARENYGSHPECGGRYTLSSDRPSPDKMSGSRQSGTPLPLPYPSRDSLRGGRLPARRWSL